MTDRSPPHDQEPDESGALEDEDETGAPSEPLEDEPQRTRYGADQGGPDDALPD